MKKYFETWILYRTTAEALKRENFLFQNSKSNLSEPDENRLLVERELKLCLPPKIRNSLRSSNKQERCNSSKSNTLQLGELL